MWLSKEVLHTSLLYTSPRRDAVIVTLFAAVSFILPAVFLNSPAVAAMKRKSWKTLRKAKKYPSRLAVFYSRLSAR
ncbi:hypothetical protein CEO49_13545 [Klebsiella variicola]|nr:hypothetical protein KR75_07595 [Klebsiella variicola]OZM19877.1 hypothetical protein CEO49_13545 [Klebsiella variicola]HBY1620028.1 hypothetical protein [Klebsiella variicola]